MSNVYATRSATVISARRKAADGTIVVGQMLTATKRGRAKVGFSANGEGAGVLIDLVGRDVEVSSRFVGAGVLLINAVSAQTEGGDEVRECEAAASTRYAGCTLTEVAPGNWNVKHDRHDQGQDGFAVLSDAQDYAQELSDALDGAFRL